MLGALGYKVSSGLSDVISAACLAMRIVLIIVPSQTIAGSQGPEEIPFCVRFTRAVSLSEQDTTFELQ
eukprot:1891000-Amphidinium_carterae.1